MKKKGFEAFVVGHPDVVSQWPHKAAAAGVLLHAYPLSGDLDADYRRDPSSFCIGRGDLALPVMVSMDALESQSPDEWALFIHHKSLSEEQTLEARRLVLDFARAFDADTVTTLITVEKKREECTFRGECIYRPLTQENLNDDL